MEIQQVEKFRKKKAEGTSVAFIIGLSIFLVILLIVGFSVLYYGGDLKAKISILFGSWNASKPPGTDFEIIRYNLESDKIQYYDGFNWHDLIGEISMNNKVINSSDLYKDISEDYYYGSRDFSRPIKIDNTVNQKIGRRYTFGEIKIVDFSPASKGFVIWRYYFLGDSELDTNYYRLGLNNQFDERSGRGQMYQVGKVEFSEGSGPSKFKNNLPLIEQNNPNVRFAKEIKQHLQNLDNMVFPWSMEQIYPRDENRRRPFRELFNAGFYSLANGYSLITLQDIDYLNRWILNTFTGDPQAYKIVWRFSKDNRLIEVWLTLLRGYQRDLGSGVNSVSGGLKIIGVITAEDLNTMTFVTFSPRKIDEPEREMVRKIKEWRDSILFKPVAVRHKERLSGEIKKEYYCPKFFDNKYIVVNLAEPVSSGELCDPWRE